MTTVFRGIFLTAEDPARTAKFYEALAGMQLEPVQNGGYKYWKLDDGDLQISIHDARTFADYTYPGLPESNLTHLYFKIGSQDVFMKRLGSLSIQPYATDDVVVTVVDPDGRKVMFGTA